ncbi:hypothetical protein V8E52_006712 [Russula decolorans]
MSLRAAPSDGDHGCGSGCGPQRSWWQPERASMVGSGGSDYGYSHGHGFNPSSKLCLSELLLRMVIMVVAVVVVRSGRGGSLSEQVWAGRGRGQSSSMSLLHSSSEEHFLGHPLGFHAPALVVIRACDTGTSIDVDCGMRCGKGFVSHKLNLNGLNTEPQHHSLQTTQVVTSPFIVATGSSRVTRGSENVTRTRPAENPHPYSGSRVSRSHGCGYSHGITLILRVPAL